MKIAGRRSLMNASHIIMKKYTLRKLSHAIYRDFFQMYKLKISLENNWIFFLFLHKTLIVGTR